MDNFTQDSSTVIKNARKRRLISQCDMAKKVGLSTSLVSRVENRQKISFASLKKITDFLGLDILKMGDVCTTSPILHFM
jgi:transcriptional regulator with XRE-family HTH domain